MYPIAWRAGKPQERTTLIQKMRKILTDTRALLDGLLQGRLNRRRSRLIGFNA